MSAAELSRQLKVPTNRITEIPSLHGAEVGLQGETRSAARPFLRDQRRVLDGSRHKVYEFCAWQIRKAGDTIKALPTLASRRQGGSQPRPL